MLKKAIVGILTYMPLILLLFVAKPDYPAYSRGIMLFCVKDELLFRELPFQFIDRNEVNSLLIGLVNGLFFQFFAPVFTKFSLFLCILFGVSYTMGRLRYSFLESVMLRHLFLAFLFMKKEV
jgi:hypothetical protein